MTEDKEKSLDPAEPPERHRLLRGEGWPATTHGPRRPNKDFPEWDGRREEPKDES